MLIKCQTSTQKFQEHALLTKASACHKHIEEFCVACRVLLLLTVFWDDIKTFSFLFPIAGNTLVYYVFLSFVVFFLLLVDLPYFLLHNIITGCRRVLNIHGYKVQAPHWYPACLFYAKALLWKCLSQHVLFGWYFFNIPALSIFLFFHLISACIILYNTTCVCLYLENLKRVCICT